MPTLYLIALVVGGALVVLSLLGGDADADVDVDADLDADADVDADADADADADGDGEANAGIGGQGSWVDGAALWFPFASLRFWTFFLAFGGLIGSLLSLFDLLATVPTAVVSTVVGYVCGLGISTLVRKLRTEVVDSTVGERDLVGLTGTVLLPVSKGETGQVRVRVKGRLVDLVATTEDADELPIRGEALVYEVGDDGVLFVTATPATRG